MVVHNLDCLHRGFMKLKQSRYPAHAPAPQMQTPVVTQAFNTLVPMDIDQSQPRPDTFTCYNCSEKGHLLCHCLKPQKQQIQSTALAKVDLKSLVAKAVAMALDTQEVMKKSQEDF